MQWVDPPETQSGQSSELSVNVTSRADLLADLEARLSRGQGFCVATLNLDHIVKLRREPAFHRAYLDQTHVTADGNPIVWFSRLAGQPMALVPGSELVEPMIERACALGVRIAFFGSAPEVLATVTDRLQARFAGLQVAASLSPPMGFDPEGAAADRYIADLGASGAGLCFVALGAPKQEIFAARAARALPEMGFLSIGAGLDFIAGHQTRAPRLVRMFAGEWLWRMLLSPRRLAGRYGACLLVMPGLFRRALQARRTAR
jgi:exopolysaccharide biosynthesis WecB/TagA/CpsF family protein